MTTAPKRKTDDANPGWLVSGRNDVPLAWRIGITFCSGIRSSELGGAHRSMELRRRFDLLRNSCDPAESSEPRIRFPGQDTAVDLDFIRSTSISRSGIRSSSNVGEYICRLPLWNSGLDRSVEVEDFLGIILRLGIIGCERPTVDHLFSVRGRNPICILADDSPVAAQLVPGEFPGMDRLMAVKCEPKIVTACQFVSCSGTRRNGGLDSRTNLDEICMDPVFRTVSNLVERAIGVTRFERRLAATSCRGSGYVGDSADMAPLIPGIDPQA